MAGSSAECTNRYTVIFDTRMSVATSATVKNFASDSEGRSAVMLHRSPWHEPHTGFPTGATTVLALTIRVVTVVTRGDETTEVSPIRRSPAWPYWVRASRPQ
jgi:hypothetical protein